MSPRTTSIRNINSIRYKYFGRRLTREPVIIASVHDANHGGALCGSLPATYGDGRWELGRSEDVLTESKLSDLFATSMEAVSWRSHKLFVASSEHPTP